MSTQTTTTSGFEFAAEKSAAKPGFWSRLGLAFMAAREREARLRVSQHLSGMSDKELSNIGYSDVEISTLRSTGRLPQFFGI